MRKKHPEHVNLERWLVSYADFITLLFAFFVIMYAMAKTDSAKFAKVAASIRSAFNAAGPVGMIDIGGMSGGHTANNFDIEESPGGRALNMPAGKTNTAADPDPQLQEMKDLLEETVSLELGATDASERMQLLFDSRGLIVRLAAKDFFDEGQVEVRQDLRPILDRIGRVIAKSKRLARVEGHADRNEARTRGYASAWELSAARAAWVVNYWMARFEIEPRRLAVAGYSYFRPLTEGTSAWDRSKNRRIEIIILNNAYTQP